VIVPVVGVIIRDRAVIARYPAVFIRVDPTEARQYTPFVKNCFLGIVPSVEDSIVISTNPGTVNALVVAILPSALNREMPFIC